MTYRDKSILEDPEKMCEYCCNFDKEHIGMDCTALCKLTMTLAYAEDYGGNCMFYNVPKEQIIVPPCKVGDTVWVISHWYKYTKPEIESRKILSVQIYKNGNIQYHYKDGCFWKEFIGKTVFLTKEGAEEKLKELGKNG